MPRFFNSVRIAFVAAAILLPLALAAFPKVSRSSDSKPVYSAVPVKNRVCDEHDDSAFCPFNLRTGKTGILVNRGTNETQLGCWTKKTGRWPTEQEQFYISNVNGARDNIVNQPGNLCLAADATSGAKVMMETQVVVSRDLVLRRQAWRSSGSSSETRGIWMETTSTSGCSDNQVLVIGCEQDQDDDTYGLAVLQCGDMPTST